jgi:hypothetical protein
VDFWSAGAWAAHGLPAPGVTILTHRDADRADPFAEMVIPRTPRAPNAPRLHATRVLLACALLVGCTSIEGPTSDVNQWKQTWKGRAGAVAEGAGRGAEVVGESLGTAYRGVRSGFQEPNPNGFGPYPDDYAAAVKRHMLRFEGVDEDASFRFGRPLKGYSNDGILAGGEVDWQGYIVDLEVETERFGGQKRTKAYVVRIRAGEVVEVLDATYAGALKRFDASMPAARAD